MSYQKTAYETLESTGGFAKTTKAEKIMMQAQIQDVEMLYDGQSTISENQKEMNVRLENVERDVAEIKENMASKDDLKEFEGRLIPEIRKAAQFDLVKDTANWKVVLAVVVVFFVAVILAGFGLRGLEILAPIGNTAAGQL